MKVALRIRVPFFVHLFTFRSFLCVWLNRVSFSAEILEVIFGFFFLFNPLIISLLAFARFFLLPPPFLLELILILFLLRLLFLLLILILLPLSTLPFSLLLPLCALILPGFALAMFLLRPRAKEVRFISFFTFIRVCLMTPALLKRRVELIKVILICKITVVVVVSLLLILFASVTRRLLTGAQSFFTKCIINFLLSLIAKHFVSVVNFLEFLGCSLFVACSLVRMALFCELVKGSLDLFLIALSRIT